MALEYINSKINDTNYNDLFCEIYNKYEQYDFINREYCKNYLLIIFSELFKKNIDLSLIQNTNEIIQRNEQEYFRNNIISRFEMCIISDIHYESCQASHIYDLKYEPLNYDINNSILLNATLHLEFDKLKWCIDPYTYKIIISEKYKSQNLEIKKYVDTDLQTKLHKYPHMLYYLKKKYIKFIEHQNI